MRRYQIIIKILLIASICNMHFSYSFAQEEESNDTAPADQQMTKREKELKEMNSISHHKPEKNDVFMKFFALYEQAWLEALNEQIAEKKESLVAAQLEVDFVVANSELVQAEKRASKYATRDRIDAKIQNLENEKTELRDQLITYLYEIWSKTPDIKTREAFDEYLKKIREEIKRPWIAWREAVDMSPINSHDAADHNFMARLNEATGIQDPMDVKSKFAQLQKVMVSIFIQLHKVKIARTLYMHWGEKFVETEAWSKIGKRFINPSWGIATVGLFSFLVFPNSDLPLQTELVMTGTFSAFFTFFRTLFGSFVVHGMKSSSFEAPLKVFMDAIKELGLTLPEKLRISAESPHDSELHRSLSFDYFEPFRDNQQDGHRFIETFLPETVKPSSCRKLLDF